MKKLNKPQKYSEINVEFYSAEGVPPVQSTPSTNNSTYGQSGGGCYNSSGSTNSNSSSSGESAFEAILAALLGLDD